MSAASEAPVFLTADWRSLVLLNWPVDPEILRERIPRGCTLDFFEGRTFVSLVGFRFLDTRVLSIPIPFHRDFDEVNLRFYVRRDHPEGSRRGVAFVKEIVPRRAIAWVARNVYNENYVALPMEHEVALPGTARYGWRSNGDAYRLRATVAGEPTLPAPGSEEEFIAEHYWGYAAQPDGSTVEYRVEHPPWRVWRATSSDFAGPASRFYGPELAEVISGPPSSAFVAEGSPVVVRKGVPIRPVAPVLPW